MQLPIIKPRLYQLPAISALQRGCRRLVKTWPRRSGKDVTDFSYMVSEAIRTAGNYYYMFPTRAWATRALWDNMPSWTRGKRLIDIICTEEIVAAKNNSDYFIDLKNGSRIKIDGTDNMNFVGQGGSGYVLSEFQSHKEEVTGFLSPILRESDAFVIFNGTLRGKANNLWKMYDNNLGRDGWFAQWLTLEHTKTDYWISPEDDLYINPELQGLISPYTGKPFTNIQDEVDAGMISFAMARQEFLNEAVSQVSGSYYSRELSIMEGEGRLKTKYEVYTFWDLGGVTSEADTTAIVFATINKWTNRVDIIDYYENVGHLRGHYMDVIKGKPYKYGGHFIPHDGKRRNTFTGEGMAETALSKFGIEMRYIPKADSTASEIEIVRRDLGNYWIDLDKCQKLYEHLTKYHENESTQKPCHRNNCSMCRGASHGADTVRLMAMARHLKLVEPYLDSGYKTWTPSFISDDAVIV
jgi:hypothetical protein